MTTGNLKPTHKSIKLYHDSLAAYAGAQVSHEGATETAFSRLLADTAKSHGWMLIPKLPVKHGKKTVIPDGTVRDMWFPRGHWEAKDTDDNLATEIRKKIEKGYPLTNIIFEDTRNAVLFQNSKEVFRADLTQPQQVCDLLNTFFSYTEPHYEGFEQAVDEFKERVPELAQALAQIIKDNHESNQRFQTAFEKIFTLCQTALNPNIRREAVDEMLIQHLLTERLIRTIFDKDDFTRQNVIAAEVETVIDALTGQSFSRHKFLKSLDKFYIAIEHAAANLEDFSEKQHFLNTVYERFFQGYSVKVADTHGIVYTPQEIVDFMCASVAEVLEKEFGKSLGDKDVHILDPCTGTGNFIVNLINRIPKKDLQRMYGTQLFANEVMLLPYYIAALNIEHAYYERTGQYESFDGLCFVDTLDLAEKRQATFEFMNEENTQRVERQKNAPITVIIGNPPYNANQINENDNNKNRIYPEVDRRIKQTYVQDSNASLRAKSYDMYWRFIRWASDRLNSRDGIVCMITNNGFLHGIAADGFRKHLAKDYYRVFHLDLRGNARTSGQRRRDEGGNVFDDKVRVGVGITLLVKRRTKRSRSIHYRSVGPAWRSAEKLKFVRELSSASAMRWQRLFSDEEGHWNGSLTVGAYARFLRLAPPREKVAADPNACVVKNYCLGVSTNRDQVVYDFQERPLLARITEFAEHFNAEVDRLRRHEKSTKSLHDFVDYSKIKWSEKLKKRLQAFHYIEAAKGNTRLALYRPFTKQYLYYDDALIDRPSKFGRIFPDKQSQEDNRVIAMSDIGFRAPGFSTLIADGPCDLHLCAGVDGHQCFPFYVYDEEGSNRRENITDWALNEFRKHYSSKKITKWDIFYYAYGLLHHPGYREKYADNLKRELPRIPYAPDFAAFSKAGEKLAKLHLDYEQLKEWPLKWIETPDVPLSYHVEKMKLAKDKKSLRVNDSLTLADIPPDVFNYRLGNRSALEWVIDQYQISEDKRSGIKSDPNRPEDPEYIVRLVGQVTRLSLDTVKIINALPTEFEPPS